MGNDEEVVKVETLREVEGSLSSDMDKKFRDEEIRGFDGVRVLENDGKVDGIDVNVPLEEFSTGKNVGGFVDGCEVEGGLKEDGFGNGEIGVVNGDDRLRGKEECGGGDGDGNNGNTEVVGEHSSEGKVLESTPRWARRSKIEGGGSSNSNVKGETDKKMGDFPSSVSQRTRNRVVKGKKEDVENGASELDDEADDDLESGFCVGDFVWGKIKSHPWWPGRVYSPSNASGSALKHKHEGRLLVAYFGDGTFAWCDPSQLKPFQQTFEEMSKQSSLKNFVNAVEEAVDEYGRLVEIQMTCSCARKGESLLPLVVNAGIQEGVCVPPISVENFSVDHFEPTVMIADVKNCAGFASIPNILQLRVLKSILSVFYHAKGGCTLPIYHEPMGIEELVHENNVPLEGLTRGPDDGDWFVSPEDRSLMQNGNGTSCDGSRTTKEKSMVEILGIDTNVELEEKLTDSFKGQLQSRELTPKSGKKRQRVRDMDKNSGNKLDNAEAGISKEESESEKLASKSGSRSRRTVDENQCHAGKNLRVTRSSAKKQPSYARLTTARKRVVNNKKVSPAEKVQMEMNKKPRDGKMRVSLVDNGLTSEVESERMSPRERKKSKYLSPPYTNLLLKQRNSTSQMGSEAGGLEFSDVSKMGQRMSNVTGKLVGSPPIMKCSAETFQKSSRGVDSVHMKTDNPGRQIRRSGLSFKVDDPMKNIGTSDKVLSDIRSAARNPRHSSKDLSFDTIGGFLSAYRSVTYKNGSNYKKHKADHRKRKRNLSDTNNALDGNVQNQVGQHSSKPKTPKRSASKIQDRMSDYKGDQQLACETTSLAVLVMTFPPELTLPSKEDLLKMHSKFGELDESKSKVIPKSSTAKIVFAKRLDAEAARDCMHQSSPFGSVNVSCKIRRLSAASRSKKVDVLNKKKRKSEKLESKPIGQSPSGAVDNQPLVIVILKQKLDEMTSMLAQTDGKKMTKEIKSNLENNAKEFLKKVKMMHAAASSSS